MSDRAALYERLPKRCVIAELGVAEGDNAETILEINQPTRLYLIDTWASSRDYESVQKRFGSSIADGRVVLLRARSWEALDRIADSSLGWAYIDAGHDYESVKRDLDAVWRKIAPGGFIAGHDYTRWAIESGKVRRYGVVEAVNEFANQSGAPLAYLTSQRHRHLSFALQLAAVTDAP